MGEKGKNMVKERTVSIIIPVYQVREYLERAIQSVLAQTFTDFELFLVDDGSTDGCGEICDRFAEEDPRICVIHQANAGAARARNTAMKRACGKYLYFMDADDWAEPRMLEQMVSVAEHTEAQLTVFGFYIDTFDEKGRSFSQMINAGSWTFPTAASFRKEAYRFFDHNLLYTPWNKLYLHSYIREIKAEFPVTKWDDFPFNLMVVRDIERVSVRNEAGYHFQRIRKDSESEMWNPMLYEKREEEHSWMLELYRYWRPGNENSREMVARRYAERLVGCIENLTNPSCELSGREKREKIAQMITSKRFEKAMRYARPKSWYMRALLKPMSRKQVWITYLEGMCISLVKERFTVFFSKIKAGR